MEKHSRAGHRCFDVWVCNVAVNV